MLMADDKTTKTPEQPVTDSGPGKETPPAPPKEPEKVSVSPEPEKKTEPEVKNPQVSVYNFAEIMKEKKVEERAAAPSGEKPAPAKTEKPEKQPEAPKKAEEKPKEPEQSKRRGRPPKADKDKAATPKPEAPAQKPENAVKKEPEKKTAPTVQAAPAPKEPEKPKDAPRRGKEQIVYIKLNELHAFKNHPFEVRDDEEMRAMVYQRCKWCPNWHRAAALPASLFVRARRRCPAFHCLAFRGCRFLHECRFAQAADYSPTPAVAPAEVPASTTATDELPVGAVASSPVVG